MWKPACLTGALFVLTACTSSGVATLGPQLYAVNVVDSWDGMASARAKATEEARRYCAARGLVMYPEKFSADGAMVDLTFRCESADGRPAALPAAEPTVTVRLR